MYAEAVTQKAYADEESYAPRKPKKIKSNFIAKWLLKSLKNEAEQENQKMSSGNQIKGLGINRPEPSIDQPDKAIQFTVFTANGGRVVETRRYDRRTDRNTNSLYVITSEQDFGKEIDKIITMESLKS